MTWTIACNGDSDRNLRCDCCSHHFRIHAHSFAEATKVLEEKEWKFYCKEEAHEEQRHVCPDCAKEGAEYGNDAWFLKTFGMTEEENLEYKGFRCDDVRWCGCTRPVAKEGDKCDGCSAPEVFISKKVKR